VGHQDKPFTFSLASQQSYQELGREASHFSVLLLSKQIFQDNHKSLATMLAT
jgi:predicted dienelactone hydrolase